MSIRFLEGFELVAEQKLPESTIVENVAHSIGYLSDMAKDCSNIHAALSDGNIPNGRMIINLSYTATLLNNIICKLAGELESINVEAKKSE